METNKTPSIGYEGKVTVAVMRGKNKIKEHEIKNAGCKSLFRFIAKTLCGEFATSLRPCKIRLFGKSVIDNQDIATDSSS